MVDFKIKDKFIIRAPYYPLNKLDDNSVWTTDALFEEKEFLNLISSSSPTLIKEIEKKKDKEVYEKEKLLLSLRKYYIRLCSRSTPFQALSTYSIAEKGNDLSSIIKFDEKIELYYSFDTKYLYSIYKAISKIESFQNISLYFTNPTIIRIGKNFHYLEYFMDEKDEKYQLSKIEYHSLYRLVFKYMNDGGNLQFLKDKINEAFSGLNDIDDVIEFLIDSKLLVSEFEYLTMIDSQVDRMAEIIDKHVERKDSFTSLFLLLHRNFHLIKREPLHSVNNVAKSYLDESIKDELALESFFSVNTKKKLLEKKLNSKIFDQLYRAVHFFFRICYYETDKDKQIQNLIEFKKQFTKRYEVGRKVPLSEALDPLVGLGYPFGNTLKKEPQIFKDIILPEIDKNDNSEESYSYLELLIFKRCIGHEVIITDEDFKNKETKKLELAKSFYIVTEIFNTNNDNFIIDLRAVGGCSAIQPLLRYQKDDSEIKNIIEEISEYEDERINDNYILADIIYCTNGKIDNVLIHKKIKDNEIILKNNTPHDSQKIYLSDIYLYIDNDGNIQLWSKSLKKKIIPINYTVHNADINDNHYYRFFSDFSKLFFQDDLTIPMSQLFRNLDFIPRIRYENCIFFRACWHLTPSEIKWIKNLVKENDPELIIKIEEWRLNRNIPERVVYNDFDRSLLIDFKYLSSINILLSSIAKNKKIWLFEFLGDSYSYYTVDDKGNNYASEFIFLAENRSNL